MEGLSARLREGMHRLAGQPVSLRRIAALHGRSAPGAVLVVLSLACVLPVPGAGMIFSLGVAALAGMLWQGRRRMPLPWRVGRVQLPPRSAARVLVTLASLYALAGRFSRARWSVLAEPRQHGWMAVLVALMALLIFLPIPFGNVLPALAVLLLGLGLMARDGVLVLAAVATALLALATLGLLAWAGVELGSLLAAWLPRP